MSMKLKVDVSLVDILHAKRFEVGRDPVSRAIRRQFPKNSIGLVVHPGKVEIYFRKIDTLVEAPLPKKVDDFLRDLRARKEVEPFTFTLSIPGVGR